MSDCRFSPVAVLPKFKGGNGTLKTSFYPAELWERRGGRRGLFRVMIGSSWLNRDGEDISFFTLDGVSRIILRHLEKGLKVESERPGVQPDCPKGTAVRYWPDGQTQPLETFTRTEPFADQYGEWAVWIFFKKEPVRLVDLEYRPGPAGASV